MKKTGLILSIILLGAFLTIGCSTSKKEEGQKTNMENEQKTTEPQFTENPHYIITVSSGDKVFGDIEIELFPKIAPKHVANFDSLVTAGAYNGTAFHRVIPGFMIQGGDPNSIDKPKNTWGYGDPNQTKVPAEFNDTKHLRGIISAARSQDPNSASSQFFIMHGDASHLDGQYTAYGKVVSGMEIVDEICKLPLEGPQKSAPVNKVEMQIKKK